MAEASLLGFLQERLTWDGSKELISSLIGALTGAYAGAMAARRIAATEKEHESLLAEIRASNAACSFAFAVCNSGLTLKKQHVLRMKQEFDSSRAALLEFKAAREAGKISRNAEFHFRADLNSLPALILPTEALQTIAVEKLTLGSRPMSCLTTIIQSSVSLDAALKRRNKIIEKTRANREAGLEPITPQTYFGFPDKDGHVDCDFADTVEAIYKAVDDVIFFGWLLGEDLVKHGEAASSLFKRRHGTKNLPIVRKADFSKARKDGLMPDENDYQDWLAAFQAAPKKNSRWRRFRKAI